MARAPPSFTTVYHSPYHRYPERNKMATRRIISSEKTILDVDADGNHQKAAPSNITPAVPTCVYHVHSIHTTHPRHD